MKKNKQNFNLSCVQLDNTNGITLIALIVTIIVLLAIAGISISMLTGENSIIKNAQKARLETETSTVEEKVKLAVMGAYNNKGTFDLEKLKEELNNMGVTYSEAGSELLIELPNGKQIMVSKTTGDIREGVHKIAYNYNGGDDIGIVPSDDTEYKEGDNITIKFSPIGEREGFEFLGWSTSAGATTAEFTSTGTNTIRMESKSITLYAVWKAIPYTLSYNANTGTGAVPTAGTGIKEQDITISFTSLPTKTGYTFVGWSENQNSNSAEYTSDGISTIKMPAKNVILYAIWMANSNTSYKVEHYQMDTSGNYPTEKTGSNTYTNGTTGESITVADLKKSYVGFEYKYGQVNGTTVESTTVEGDGSRVIKLYYERKKYTLTFNGNGGSSPTAITTYHGATITLPTPTREHYTFNGWFTATTSGSKVDYKTMPMENKSVYAQWTENNQYVIGDEVTVGGENFFVIENSKYSQTTVKLLSKFNLNTAGNAQQNAVSATTACAFSSNQYWTGNSTNLNTNNAPSGSAYQKAKAYGIAKGGTGRLPTYDEAVFLRSTMYNEFYGKNIGAEGNWLRFWLGTSDSSTGNDGNVALISGIGDIRYNAYSVAENYGVRPVIDIFKSKIS